MIILDTTTNSLQFVLATPVIANPLQFSASYVDITPPTFNTIQNDGVSNNTTPVTLIASPSASTYRQAKVITIYNNDSQTAVVTVQYNQNGTLRTIIVANLQPNETLQYTDGTGWQILNPSMGVKVNQSTSGIVLIAAKQCIVNFGAHPTLDAFVTVIDSTVSPSTPILVTQDGGPTPDKSQMGDENEMDPIDFNAQPGVGQFTLRGMPSAGPVVGQYKVNYLVLPNTAAPITIGPLSLSIPIAAWFKGSSFDYQANGSDVTEWPDLSGNAVHAFPQGSAGSRPTVSKNAINNNLTAVRNIQANRGFRTTVSPLTVSNIWSVFAVVYFSSNALTGDSTFFGVTASGISANQDSAGMNYLTNQMRIVKQNFTSTLNSSGTFLLNAWNYLVLIDNATVYTVYVNGYPWTLGTLSSDGANSNLALMEGGYNSATQVQPMDGQMAELAVYNGVLSGNDITTLNNYARVTYGLK